MSASNSAFEFQDFGNYTLLVLLPPLNDEWSQVEVYAKEILAEVNNSESPRLVLDLNSLDYCGSAVVALMVRIWKNVQDRNGDMEVCCSSEVVRQVLETARLTDIWELHERREDAERALGVSEGYASGTLLRRAAILLFVLALLYGGAAALVSPLGLKVLPIASAVVGGIFLVLAVLVWFRPDSTTAASRIALVALFGITLVLVGLIAGRVSWTEATAAYVALACVVLVLMLMVYWFAWSTLDQACRSAPAKRASAPSPLPTARPGDAGASS